MVVLGLKITFEPANATLLVVTLALLAEVSAYLNMEILPEPACTAVSKVKVTVCR